MQPPRQEPQQRVPLEKNNERATDWQKLRGMPQQNWFMTRGRVRRGHIALAVMVACVFGVFMMFNNARVHALSVELEEVKTLVSEAYNEVREKERQLQFSETEEFVDQQARQRFGYLREDEIRFVVDESINTTDFTQSQY